MDDMFALEEWSKYSPDALPGLWYKDFGSFKPCGENHYPKTFLLIGQAVRGREID